MVKNEQNATIMGNHGKILLRIFYSDKWIVGDHRIFGFKCQLQYNEEQVFTVKVNKPYDYKQWLYLV